MQRKHMILTIVPYLISTWSTYMRAFDYYPLSINPYSYQPIYLPLHSLSPYPKTFPFSQLIPLDFPSRLVFHHSSLKSYQNLLLY